MSKAGDPAARYRAGASNSKGREFEAAVKLGCAMYHQEGRADVSKTPEPFRVIKKQQSGIFTGQFTAHAEPDFKGTLDGGRSIIFEAKYTVSGRMKRDVLTKEQMDTLEDHHRRGALAGVCAGIGERCFFVPWPVWRDMKRLWGRKTVTAEDLEAFRVKNTGAVLFLDYVHGAKGPWIEAKNCDFNRWRRKKA